jgi:dolichol kinase
VTLPFFPPAPALAGAVIAAVTECLPLPLNDNITIPLAAGTTLTLLRAAPL